MGNYQKRIGSPIITTGNELVKQQIADFSKELNLKELYSYITAVKDSTVSIFPIDFHIYEIAWSENGRMQIGVETAWQVIDGCSYSGDKKTMKQLRKLYKKIYLYYGVTAEDIKIRRKGTILF